MDSINAQQPEDKREDLFAEDAVEKIRAVVDDSPNCFFCTTLATSDTNASRPMNVRKVDDQGNLWFLSASDSHKNREIEIDPVVHLYFQGTRHSDFLHLTGQATISRDRAKIHQLWEPLIRTWFTGGEDDPRITVIRVTPTDGYYWDTKHGNAVAGLKMFVGSLIGKTLDDSIEGALRI